MGKLDKWKEFDNKAESHGEGKKTLWQFVKYSVISWLCGATNFGVLNICLNIPAIQNLFSVPFHWFVFNYPVSADGLGYFISYNIANICAQLVQYFANRKTNFKADNSVAVTLSLFMGFTVLVLIFAAWLSPYLNALVLSFGAGPRIGANITTMIMGFIEYLIYFPFDKLIMKKKKNNGTDNADAAFDTVAEEK